MQIPCFRLQGKDIADGRGHRHHAEVGQQSEAAPKYRPDTHQVNSFIDSIVMVCIKQAAAAVGTWADCRLMSES